MITVEFVERIKPSGISVVEEPGDTPEEVAEEKPFSAKGRYKGAARRPGAMSPVTPISGGQAGVRSRWQAACS